MRTPGVSLGLPGSSGSVPEASPRLSESSLESPAGASPGLLQKSPGGHLLLSIHNLLDKNEHFGLEGCQIRSRALGVAPSDTREL